MSPIPAIADLEKKFLDVSSTDDIGVLCNWNTATIIPKASEIMTAADVRHDTAVLGRILINGYCGWPYHDEIVKRKVLMILDRIFTDAHDMSSNSYFSLIKDVLVDIPDNHICMVLDKQVARIGMQKPGANVGDNIARGEQSCVKTMMRADNIAVIGFAAMCNIDQVGQILQNFRDDIRRSDALIVDVRGNSGGNSYFSDHLAWQLCGAQVQSARAVFIRNNPDAARVIQSNPYILDDIRDRHFHSDPVRFDNAADVPVDMTRGYNRPVYILTNRGTASSAEMFVARMKQHPHVRLVGENTKGCEVFGNMGTVFLPHSRIVVRVGIQYRELEWDNFETNGFVPDIRVADGMDAMNVAVADFTRQKILVQAKEKNK